MNRAIRILVSTMAFGAATLGFAVPSGAKPALLAAYVPAYVVYNTDVSLAASGPQAAIFGPAMQSCASVFGCANEGSNTGKVPSFSNVSSQAQDSFGNYYHFTVAAPASEVIVPLSIAYHGVTYMGSSHISIAVRTSLDNFAANVAGSEGGVTVDSDRRVNIESDVSSLGALPAGIQVWFRVYLWSDISNDWIDLLGDPSAPPLGLEMYGSATPVTTTAPPTTQATTTTAGLAHTGSGLGSELLGAVGLLAFGGVLVARRRATAV